MMRLRESVELELLHNASARVCGDIFALVLKERLDLLFYSATVTKRLTGHFSGHVIVDIHTCVARLWLSISIIQCGRRRGGMDGAGGVVLRRREDKLGWQHESAGNHVSEITRPSSARRRAVQCRCRF